MADPLIVACPRCRKNGPWLEAKWKPFCSDRCRLIDLGDWFEGNHKISEPLRPEHFAEFEQLADGTPPDQPAE